MMRSRHEVERAVYVKRVYKSRTSNEIRTQNLSTKAGSWPIKNGNSGKVHIAEGLMPEMAFKKHKDLNTLLEITAGEP
jgi:hypothetical protein